MVAREGLRRDIKIGSWFVCVCVVPFCVESLFSEVCFAIKLDKIAPQIKKFTCDVTMVVVS